MSICRRTQKNRITTVLLLLVVMLCVSSLCCAFDAHFDDGGHSGAKVFLNTSERLAGYAAVSHAGSARELLRYAGVRRLSAPTLKQQSAFSTQAPQQSGVLPYFSTASNYANNLCPLSYTFRDHIIIPLGSAAPPVFVL